ncbi:MAG: serine/threonine protein kinase, partial [Candidatus Aminicenantes bacterium]|nr:serine/threonine protein kinase [Candidatus Aminicenantes bacterium]
MGIVYRALDPDINRKVAIKTIRFDLASEETDNEEIMQRFMREAQAAGKLTHPNIITIFDVGREKDLTYIVMQFIEGPSLQRLIAQGEKFSVQDVTKLMETVCGALDYAHQHGIVHRDIKPGNILLDNNRRPYICDFGVARVETSTLTQSGTAVGTPSYMSPEQVMGKKVDKRSDIFSIGCILYEILAGRRPFEAESITTVIYKIINEEPPALSELKKGLPAGFGKIIGKALAKDANNRYQNCNQLAEDLRNLDRLSDKTVAVTVTREATIPEVEEKEEEKGEEKKKRRLGLILGITIPAVLIIAAGGAYFYNEQTGKLPFVTEVVQKI